MAGDARSDEDSYAKLMAKLGQFTERRISALAAGAGARPGRRTRPAAGGAGGAERKRDFQVTPKVGDLEFVALISFSFLKRVTDEIAENRVKNRQNAYSNVRHSRRKLCFSNALCEIYPPWELHFQIFSAASR